MKIAESMPRPGSAENIQEERRVVLLGSTGSIGVNALQVVDLLGESCRVVGLSAYGNVERLVEQIKR